MADKKGKPENLLPVRTKEEARERGRNGGIASGEARRKKRTMKAAAKMLLDMAVSNQSARNEMIEYGVPEEEMTNQMAVMVAMLDRATRGNVNAALFLRDTIGESPAERMHMKDSKLHREEFEYRKEKDAGAIGEIEDMEELEADIYGEKETE